MCDGSKAFPLADQPLMVEVFLILTPFYVNLRLFKWDVANLIHSDYIVYVHIILVTHTILIKIMVQIRIGIIRTFV